MTLGYAIIGDNDDPTAKEYDWIHHTMKYVADKNNLVFGTDIKQIVMSNTTMDVKTYLDNNQNKTWYGSVFCTSQWEDGVTSNITIPCKPQNNIEGRNDINLYFYSILYNFTLMPSYFLDNFTAPVKTEPTLLIVKNSIDSGILNYLKQQKRLEDSYGLEFEHEDELIDESLDLPIRSTWGHWPLLTPRMAKDLNLISIVGSFYFALGPLVTFVVMLTEVVKEKEFKLRQGLSVVGLSHTSFWLHWVITGMFFSALTSLTTIITGLI